MPQSLTDLIGWWITVIEIPVLSGLFWMLWVTRKEFERALTEIGRELSDHQLDVARNYAQERDLRVLEGRITSHLLRIEAKLDVTALKAESLYAKH